MRRLISSRVLPTSLPRSATRTAGCGRVSAITRSESVSSESCPDAISVLIGRPAANGSWSRATFRTATSLFRGHRSRDETSTGYFIDSDCAGRRMLGPDHGAVARLQLVRRNPSMVESVKNTLLQPGQGPAAEIAVDRRKLAALPGQITQWWACSRYPENSIQNRVMIRRTPPSRVFDRTNGALEEDPGIVGYQIACQEHLVPRDEL